MAFGRSVAAAEEQPTAAWFITPEPAFMQPDVEIPIPGSQRTILTPALIQGDQVTYLDDASLNADASLTIESIRNRSGENSDAELSKLEPRYLRDPRGIIHAAIMDSDRPVVAATVLAPGFIEKFEKTLGPDLLVAIPNRYRIYVFPALASRFTELSEAVLVDYALTPYPVSKEVFKILPNQTLQAVGTFEPQ